MTIQNRFDFNECDICINAENILLLIFSVLSLCAKF